jgi:hypothetical protein
MTFSRTMMLAALQICLAAVLSAQTGAHEQLHYDWVPNQISATYLWTLDDYSLQSMDSSLQRTKLNGAAVEYAWRHYYPWEVVGTVQFSKGQPLDQSLLTVAAGGGYCRRFVRWTPYARVEVGMARTNSDEWMYLYKGARTGLAVVASAGGDYQLSPHWGIRAVQVQNEYLPYGSRGSVYWSVGAGITYRLRP